MKSALELKEVNDYFKKISGEEVLHAIDEVNRRERKVALNRNRRLLNLEDVKDIVNDFRESK